MRRGARDFIQKPWENERLLSIVRTQTELGRAIRRGRQLEAANQAMMSDGRSPILAEARRDAAGARDDRARGAVRRQRADYRRERHRQEPGRAGPAHRVAARQPADGHGQRRRHGRGRVRIGALRAPEGRFHRRQGRPRGPLRARRRQHAVPRRDRQRADDAAAEAAPRDRDRRVRAPGLVEDAQGQRPADLGDQRRPQRGGRGRPLPPGPLLPAQHDRDPPAAAARSPRGHSPAGPALPPAARAAVSQDHSRASIPARCSC